METLRQDLRYALRSLARQPGFAAVTVLTLALGIGANTAVFSVVNGVLLRPLGYPQPERLQLITSQFPTLGFDQFWVSLPEFVEFREYNQSFAEVGAYSIGAVNLGTDTPSRPVAALVTPELMPTLAVRPQIGRWFTAEDSAPGAASVAILSHELWQTAFGGDPQAVGASVSINDQPEEIVGVMPPGFDVHDEGVQVWRPLTIDPSTFPNRRGGHFLYLIGRLQDGVTPRQAEADIDRLLHQWDQIAPKTHVPSPEQHRLRMDPLREDIVGGVRQPLIVLQAAVALVLLIACANLANLLIARADSRRREFAVRAALGASRGRLFAQLLTEGLIMAAAAGAVGVGLAYAGLQTLLAVNPDGIPRASAIALDWPVLGFTLAVAAATGLVFAVVPLMHLRGDQVSQAVKEAGTRTTAGGARAWVRGSLIVAEVALAVILVAGAGLLIRSFVNLMRVDMGFESAQLRTFSVVLPPASYDAQRRVRFVTELESRLGALPGVQGVAAMSGLPPLRNVNANDTEFAHIPNEAPQGQFPPQNVDFWQYVTAGYPEMMGIPLVAGRTFTAPDRTGAPVVMVNEALAKKFFPDRDPLGARLRPGFDDSVPWFTIVGVLKDVKQAGVAEAAGTELYMLVDQMPGARSFAPAQMNFVVRSTVPLATLAPQFRSAVRQLDASLPIVGLRTMDDVVAAAVAQPRFLMVLLAAFAGLALLLAAVGTYGVLAYYVSERRQEIGIRMALGADRARILRLVLVRGLALSALGLVIGLGGAAALGRVVASLLFGVAPTDPATLAAVAGVIAVAAAAACAIPAWRATRVDPLVVLRDH